jgi:hypothetical protein
MGKVADTPHRITIALSLLAAGISGMGVYVAYYKGSGQNDHKAASGQNEEAQVLNLFRASRSAELPEAVIDGRRPIVFQIELLASEISATTLLKGTIHDVRGFEVWGGDIKNVRPTMDGDDLLTISAPTLTERGDYVLSIYKASKNKNDLLAQYPFRVR